ncbi:unnamed protein product [Allacma fusca]|uniref:Nose resistant-to-fluoxetine protein N-terminal domain-containing protein n=1 Tax=Allacma fusca TaxID=39272 RepID=A0A8J2KFA7_9HEXA|nr:unnamed protein product [Allacma fusca]
MVTSPNNKPSRLVLLLIILASYSPLSAFPQSSLNIPRDSLVPSFFPHPQKSQDFNLLEVDSLKKEIQSKLNNLYHFDSYKNQRNLFQVITEPDDFLESLFTQVNPICANHSQQILREITGYYNRTPETWALQMLDSWGKVPSGFLSGHVQVPGDFHECIQVEGNYSPGPSQSKQLIKGKYCTTYIVPGPALLNPETSGQTFSLAEINPGLRDSVDFLTLLEYMLQPSSLILFPMMDEKPPLDAGDYSMIGVLAAICCLCLVGTVIDSFNLFGANNKKGGTLLRVMLAFSIKTNTIKWMSTRATPDNLGCLHGLRFLSICWVVLGHTFLMYSLQYTWNLVDMKHMYRDWSMSSIFNGLFAVDTFFTLSGALIAYHLLRELDKRNGKFNYVMFAVHRFLRLTPTYIILLGIMATLLPYMGSGPGWFVIEAESKNCESYWWHNILYLNNFLSFSDGHVCYGEAWYLANDMQFYLLSPLVIYPLWKWKRIGFGILALLSIMSMIVPAVITYANELPPSPILFVDIKTLYNDVYIKPYTRCGPYIVGILLGYILHIRSKNPSKFQKFPFWGVVFGWTASTVTALALIFGPMRFNDPKNYDSTIHSWDSIFYAGTHYFLWGLVIAWVIFACVNGNGSWVNSFLSWKGFMPLGRLTFCMYISSYHLQTMYHTSQPHPGHYNKYYAVNMFFAHLGMSALVSYVLTMALESPFIQLEKILLAPGTPSTKPKPQNVNKNPEV